MAYKILFTQEAYKDVEKLDVTIKRQLHKKILHFQGLDDISVVAKKLHNHAAGDYRLRVGNFRVIFDIDKRTLVILRIQHRKDVYR